MIKCEGKMPNHEQLSSLSLSDESCEYEKSFHHWQYLLRGNPEYRVAIQKEIEKIGEEKFFLPPYDFSSFLYSFLPGSMPRDIAEEKIRHSLEIPGLSWDEFELRRYYFRLKSLVSGQPPPDFEYVEEEDPQKAYYEWMEQQGPPPPGIDGYTWYGRYDQWGSIKR